MQNAVLEHHAAIEQACELLGDRARAAVGEHLLDQPSLQHERPAELIVGAREVARQRDLVLVPACVVERDRGMVGERGEEPRVLVAELGVRTVCSTVSTPIVSPRAISGLDIVALKP